MEYVFFIAYELYTKGLNAKGSGLMKTNSTSAVAITEMLEELKQNLISSNEGLVKKNIAITSMSLIGSNEVKLKPTESEGYKHLKKMFRALYSDARAGQSDEVIHKRYHLLFDLIDGERE